MRRHLVTAVTLLLCLGLAAPAAAQVIVPPEPPRCWDCPIILPDGPVRVEKYDVEVTIDTQVATTHVTQVFRNDGNWLAEGTFLFPLPKGAAVSELVLWIDNEPVTAELLSADEAREIYEEIVRTLRDPALLEWAGHDLVRLSVFPIEPGDERKVELEYSAVLPAEGGLVRYTHPLGREHGAGAIESVTITIEAEASAPLKAIYSPTHDVDVTRDGERTFRATFEAEDVTAGEDFALYYSTNEADIGVNLLSHRIVADGDGFFLMLVNPDVVAADEAVSRDVILVLDRSGSMEGEKFEQARDALHFVLDHLNPNDHFNIVTFSSGIDTYARNLQPADAVGDAKEWIDRQAAAGSTDINLALLEAFELTSGERPATVIFLTDGLPTEGVVHAEGILDNAKDHAPEELSLFAFGVGFDVDAFLLDSLAENHHGTTDYVLPGEDIDETVSGFYAKVSTPVLTSIEIDFGDADVYDVHPSPLPDLFAGEQLVVVGRYRDPGTTAIELSGRVGSDRAAFTYDGLAFRQSGGPEFVPRLWATRKIGDLLREMRFDGVSDEVVEQVVDLSTRYGIVTPFTSFLVEEPGLISAADWDIAGERLAEEFSFSLEQRSGAGAVRYSDGAADLSDAEAAPVPTSTTIVRDGQVVAPAVALQSAGGKTFRQIDGVWIDTGFDPDTMEAVAVPFLSPAYFDLSAAVPELAAAFSLGSEVIAVHGGIAYRIVGSDEPGDEVAIPARVDDPDPLPADPPVVVTSPPVAVSSATTAAGGPEAAPMPPITGPGDGSGLPVLPIAAVSLLGLALAGGGGLWLRRARRT